MKHGNQLSENLTATLPAAPEAAQEIDRLYQRYSALVLRTAYLILGSWEEAEDLAQEVWILVARHWGRYQAERGAWSTWVHQITVNRCLSARRRWSRWRYREDQLHGAADQPARQRSPLDALLDHEQQQQIWASIHHLPLKLRVVVVLRYYHDLSYEEIARIVDCPLGTVRSRLHTAHGRLRAALKEQL